MEVLECGFLPGAGGADRHLPSPLANIELTLPEVKKRFLSSATSSGRSETNQMDQTGGAGLAGFSVLKNEFHGE